MDAKLTGNEDLVIVTINTGTVNRRDIPGIEEIKERITYLEGRNSYTKDAIEEMKDKMNQEKVNYISFEDYNTKGLRGAKNGQSDSKEDTWGIYAYNKGFHFEDEDVDLEKSRGGSHGIGKIASNSASDLYMMYFANCDEDGDKHLGGTVQLIEHKFKENYYRSTGYFTDVKDIGDNKTRYYPYNNKFHKIFDKNTRGLKIIIPFLREQFNDEKEIIKSVCDSFFIAILEDKLQVIVNGKKIYKETIKDFILSDEYYIQDPSEIKKEFTPLYYNTYIKTDYQYLTIKDIRNEYNFKLYFNYDEEIARGRVAIVRTIGMKIEDKKITSNVTKPFNAVLIPSSIREDAFLKSLENESHTELSFDHIKNQDFQKSAKKFINNISREIAKIIEDAIRKNNPADGPMDTKDILYIVENQFKMDLANTVDTVKINRGNKKTTIVTVDPAIPKKRKRKKGDNGENDDKKKKLREIKKDPKSGYSDKGKNIKFNAHPDIVKRLILGDKEIVRFDFSENKDFKGIKTCDISLAVVDGMGKEYANEFIMEDNYKQVTDKISGNQCRIDNNIIRDVGIKDNVAEIQLDLNRESNKALKFVYYVEV